MNIVNFNFKGGDVRAVLLANGEPGFVGKDVAARLGYADTTNAIKQHCRGVAIHHPIVDSMGRTQTVRILVESDVLRLIIASRLPAAQEFERWVFEEVLPAIRKTGAYALPQASASTQYAIPKSVEAMQVADALATMLRLEGSARLGMARQAIAKAAPDMLDLVPPYAIDAPKGEASDMGSRTTTSLTMLLMIHGGGMSAMQANRCLEKLGYLEQHFRPSRGKGMKFYWSITEKGLKYGKNSTHERNQHETFPLWYEHTGKELIEQIKAVK